MGRALPAPEWVPEYLQGVSSVVDAKTLSVTLPPTQPANRRYATITFDDVPGGWRIEIDLGAQRMETRVDVRNSAPAVRWVLTDVGRHAVTLGSGVRVVHVMSTGQNRCALKLTHNSINLHLDPGSYHIDGDRRYRLWLENSTDRSNFTLTGQAAFTAVTGTGQLSITELHGLDELDFEGSLVVNGSVGIETLNLGGSLTCHNLIATTVEAASVTVRGGQAPRLELGGHLRAETLNVAGSLVSTMGRAQLRIAKALSAGEVADVDIDAESNEATAKISGSAEACAFTGMWTTVSIGAAHRALSVEEALTLSITAECEGRLAAKADSVTVGSITGAGAVDCHTFHAEQPVSAADGPLTVTAAEEITIGGHAHGVGLCSGGSLSVGLHGGTMKVEPPSLPDMEQPAATAKVRLNGGPAASRREPIRECVLAAVGDAYLGARVEASIIHVEQRLAVAADLDLREVDTAATILTQLPATERSRLGKASSRLPCTADEIIAAGEVSMSDGQLATAATLMSAESIHGGAVKTTDNDGSVVARTATNVIIDADRIAVLTEPEGKTVLTAQTLMRLDKGAGEDTELTVSGDAVFGGPVIPTVIWNPAGTNRCDLSEGARSITVNAPAATTADDAAELVLGRGNTLDDITIAGALKFTVTGSAQSGGRRDPPLDPVWTTTSLGAAAHLYVAADNVDLGSVTLAADAAITRSSTSNKNPKLTLAPASTGRRLTLTPGTGLTLTTRAGGTDDRPPAVTIRGGSATITAAFNQVTCVKDTYGPPTLTVPSTGAIHDVSGEFDLALLEGRIASVRHPASGKMARVGRRIAQLWGRVTGYRWPGQEPPHGAGSPARLRRVTNPDGEPLKGGELIGVDVSRLAFADIRTLTALHVFDPDGEALIDYASDMRTTSAGGDGERPRHHDRAQRLKLIAETTASNASSGATRSSAMWAASRAQHALLNRRRHRVEWVARLLLRLVGYGYRPWPAALTYTTVILGLSALLYEVEDGTGCARFRPGPYSLGEQIVRVLLLPVSTLRLDYGGATAYAPIDCDPGLHTTAFAGTGLVLAFLVVAIRNYMRTPARR